MEINFLNAKENMYEEVSSSVLDIALEIAKKTMTSIRIPEISLKFFPVIWTESKILAAMQFISGQFLNLPASRITNNVQFIL